MTSNRSAPPWLLAVRDLLDACYLAPPSPAALAAMAGVHPVHLSRSFRARFGVTMTEYVRRRRLEHACRRLVETNHVIARIAIEAGFSDHGHFARSFRRAAGLTPSAYRRSAGRRAVGSAPPEG